LNRVPDGSKRVREYRFVADFAEHDVRVFREQLVDLAGGFTEIATDSGTRYMVGIRGRRARKRLLELLEIWAPKVAQGKIELDDWEMSPDQHEIYFLLPLQKNPDDTNAPRSPLFTNEWLATLRQSLAVRFHFLPVMVRVYGEWRSEAGALIPDFSLLIRVPRREHDTSASLRQFIREEILKDPDCDQDCIYLSSSWVGEFVTRS
jgi:hypothetical protein